MAADFYKSAAIYLLANYNIPYQLQGDNMAHYHSPGNGQLGRNTHCFHFFFKLRHHFRISVCQIDRFSHVLFNVIQF